MRWPAGETCKTGLTLSVQYRTKVGRVYEFTDGTTVLAIHLVRPTEAMSEVRWHAEGRLGTAPGSSLAEGQGASPADALRDMANVWEAQRPPLRPFDWAVVARELHVVQAV